VAHSLSAKKRIRQTLKRRARNRARKDSVKQQVKTLLGAISSGDVDKAQAEFRKTAHWLDKVAAKGTIHKNTAARRRSRLALRLNALRAGGPATATVAKPAKGRGKGKGTSAATA
jgi:small subunit ribosomal protein S20